MIRTGEDIYATLGLADVSGDELLEAIAAHPVLLERPIVVRDGRAVIARPPELLLDLLGP
jgi:arsenate reductase